MTSQAEELTHIINVWLDAADQDHPVALALRRGNYTTSRKLDKLVRTPGGVASLKYILPGETEEHELNEEQQEELMAYLPYCNFLQNQY